MAESKGVLPDFMQAAFRRGDPVIIHGVEYKKAEDVPDKWRQPAEEQPKATTPKAGD